MAAVVGGISRLFQPTIGVLSAENACKGINPWYFLIGFRMVMLFLAYGPWDSLKSDMVCQWPKDLGDTKTFCSALCFNQEFPIPISSLWVLHFMITLIIVGLMKFVFVTAEDKVLRKDVEKATKPKAESVAATGCCIQVGQNKYGGWRYGIYILCIVLILITELTFIWALLGLQLPIMNRRIVICYPNDPVCPTSAQCTLTGRADKRAILWALAFCAAANASVCIGYLATHCGQNYGCCGGPDGKGKSKAGCQSSPSSEAIGCGCQGSGCCNCKGDAGGWKGIYGYTGGTVGMEGCKCRTEGVNCCCRQSIESGKESTCNCQNYQWCPCYSQGSEAGQSHNSMCSREDSGGRLLRGDTEVGSERKEWQTLDGKMQMKEPLRTVVKKGRSSPAGGRPTKYVAKYQEWGKRKV